MSRTERYRQQHAELATIVTELERELDATRLGADASNARRLLSSLTGKLTLHLAAEDKHLYPELARSTDDNLKRMASKFAQDMAPIAKAYTEYVNKWPSPTAIKGNPAAFITESKAVINVLKGRIKKENTELYPLADSVKI
jgi:hemerythrin-like domain-containing protein